MKKLKYSFEYCCSPIWIEEIGIDKPIMENVSIDSLNVDKFLKNEIEELQRIYQSTYNERDGRESGFEDLYQYSIFINRVIFSAQLLKMNIGNEYKIVFDLENWEKLLLSANKKLGGNLNIQSCRFK